MFNTDKLKSKFKNLKIDTNLKNDTSSKNSTNFKNGTNLKKDANFPRNTEYINTNIAARLGSQNRSTSPNEIINGNSDNHDNNDVNALQPSMIVEKVRKNNSEESVSSNSLEEPLSPRKLSNKMKFTPSHYVRNSIYSDFNLLTNTEFNNVNNFPSKNKNSFTNLMNETNKVPPELSPIVTLFNCHNFRNYCNGLLQIKIGDTWIPVEAKLTGNELAIWTNNEFTPKYFNLFDYNINYDGSNLIIKFSNDLNENFYNLLIKTNNQDDFITWLSCFYLSNFERISLNESFTAVTLSLIGSKLSDIHTLLSKKKYPKSDWYNIRLPQINHKWLKVYIVINPSTTKKKGNIEIYVNEKMGKKNLIGYISDLSNVYNIFPESINMIEYNSIMKLNGEVFINRNFEHLFDDSFESFSKSNSNTSLSNYNKENNNTSSGGDKLTAPAPPGYHNHRRTTSQSSFFSNSSSPPSTPKVKNSSRFIKTNYIYLMPVHHPGVQEIETMIRNLIPILDCFKLYGRPRQLISNKLDKESLLFGLPSLPHYQYLSTTEVYSILELFLQDSISENWNYNEWSNQYKNVLEYKLTNDDYKGDGNILDLYKTLEFDQDDLKSIKSAPSINFPESNQIGTSNVNGNSESPTTPIRSRFASPTPDSPTYDPNEISNHLTFSKMGSPLSNDIDDSMNVNINVTSPKSVNLFKFENFENLDNIDDVQSPIRTLGRF